MSAPTTSILLNQTTPAAPTGDQNVTFVSDGQTPLQSISAYPKRMVGDSGSGGKAGTVPPPAAGDGAAKKWLKATGAWLAIVASDLSGAIFGASGASHSVGVVPDPGSSAGTTRYLREDATWAAPPSGTGTVTSVGLTVPSRQSVAGSPVTASGTLAITDNNQSANLVFAGPASGSAAAPTFRALTGADLSIGTAPTLVQQVVQSPATGSITFLNPTTLGNYIVVFYFYYSGVANTISDNKGNTYTKYGAINSGAALFSGFAIAPITSAGITTISTSTIGAHGGYAAFEFSGVTGIETSNPTNTGTPGTGTVAVGPITTTSAATLILSYGASFTGGTVVDVNGWAPLLVTNDGSGCSCGVFTHAAATGPYSDSFTNSAMPNFFLAGMVGLKGSTASPGSGTVTSVGLTMPSDFTVSGSPVIGAGTIAVTGGVTKSGIQQESYTYGPDTGAANAYAVTLTPAPTLVAGSECVFIAANTNTGASALAVNGGSAIAIKKNGNATAVAAGDIAASELITCKYDGTVWQLQVPGTGGGASITLTTTGSSGAATLIGTVLNVPNYSGGGGTPALVLLEQHTASSSASLDFTASITSTYDEYAIEIINLQAATSGANVLLRFSTNGGTSYDASGLYNWGQTNTSMQTAGNGANNATSASAITLWATTGSGLPTSANPGFNMSLKLFDPLNAASYKSVFGTGMGIYSGNGNVFLFTAGGYYANNSAVNALRILMSSGNIASGTVRLYGIAK